MKNNKNESTKLKEELGDNSLFIYHRTKLTLLKTIAKDGFKMKVSGGRAGRGIYAVYNDPKDIVSSIDAYGGVSIRFSISYDSLENFLIFDKEIQDKPIEQQLKKLPWGKMNEAYKKYYADLKIEKEKMGRSAGPYFDKLDHLVEIDPNDLLKALIGQKKVKQLLFIEELIDILHLLNDELENYYDGILYSVKGSASGGFGATKSTGTDKTIVVYKPELIKFEGISTDGINYKKPKDDNSNLKDIKSPEVSLKKGIVPDNTTIKKSYVKLKGVKKLNLPKGLKIIGSLDLRDIPNLEIPPDLEVTNTLYVDYLQEVPDTVIAKKISRAERFGWENLDDKERNEYSKTFNISNRKEREKAQDEFWKNLPDR